MNMFKPGAWGFVIGSIVTMIVGFSWGGWTTSSGADRLAQERSTTAVTAALVPVCLEKSKSDPAGAKKLTAAQAYRCGAPGGPADAARSSPSGSCPSRPT